MSSASEALLGGLGRAVDLVRDRILVELASDITADCFLSLTKQASLGSYEFFRSLLRVPLFMVSDSSPRALGGVRALSLRF